MPRFHFNWKSLLPRNSDDSRLYAMIGLGVVILLFVAIRSDSLATEGGVLGSWYCKSVWEVWELGALVWSFFFGFYYFFDYRIQSRDRHSFDKWFILFLFLAFLLPVCAIYALLVSHQPIVHITLEVVISIVYLTFDYCLSVWHESEDERLKYSESFLLADVPTVFANTFLYAWIITRLADSEWSHFASGAMAFQLLTCNCIFVVTQFGVVRKLRSPIRNLPTNENQPLVGNLTAEETSPSTNS